MKKTLALILATLMLFTLAACGGGGEEPAESTGGASEETTAAPVNGEIHGITKEEYAAMTPEDLITELVKDKTAPTVEEYVAIMETVDFASVSDTYAIEANISRDALSQLKKDGATLPDKLDCASVLDNNSGIVRAFYYEQLNSTYFDDTTRYYAPILAKILAEKDPVVICSILKYLSNNYGNNADFCDFVLTFAESADKNVRRCFSTAVNYIAPENKDPFVEAEIKLLKDAEPEVRKAAAQYCGALEDDRLVEPLVDILKDESLKSMHADAVGSLVDMWYDYGAHKNFSEKAYDATMEYYKGEYSDENLPDWQAINKIALKSSAFGAWAEQATYFDADEVIEIMTDIFNDATKSRLVRTHCIAVIANFGDKADLEALQSAIDAMDDSSDKTSLQGKLDAEIAKK